MSQEQLLKQLEAAREEYRRSPTEANARNCERLFLLTGAHEKDVRRIKVDVTTARQDAERGDGPVCIACGYGIAWGSGHQVEDSETRQPIWLCCPCFERETLAAFREMKSGDR